MTAHRRHWLCDPHRSRVTRPRRVAGPAPVLRVVLVDAPAWPGAPFSAAQADLLAEAAAADTARAVAAARGGLVGPASLFLRTSTPQVSPALLVDAAQLLTRFDAVIGPTTEDGWWALGLRDASLAAELRALPDAGSVTLAALRHDLRVAMLPSLRAVTSADDARAVAGLCRPDSRFATTVAGLSGVQAP